MSKNLSYLSGGKGLDYNLFEQIGLRARGTGTPDAEGVEELAVITSPARVSPEAEEALAEKTGTYRGIMFKMGDARPVLRLVEAVRQRPHRRPPTQEFHTVVRLHTVLRDRGLLQVVVPGWRPNEIVEVPWSVMSDSALRALEHDSVVRYFTATARLSASNAQELNLCNLEVSDVAPGVVDE